MKEKLICLLMFLLVINFSFLVHAKTAVPQIENLETVETYLEDFAQQIPAPGFSVAIANSEEVIYSRGFGIEDVETERKMTDDTVVAIGSLTKSFTALAMLQLVEAGQVSLADPVVNYLPEFTTLDEEQSQKITIRMLLSNTSGLPPVDHRLYINETGDEAMGKVVNRLAAKSLLFEPGRHFSYSNEGFVLAGLIIEEATGQSYAEYIEENILQPLEMNSSTTDVTKINDLEAIAGHNAGVNQALPAEPYINTATLPAGSEFRSTACDLSNYLQFLLNEGLYEDRQILTKTNVEQLFDPQIDFPAEDEGLKTDDGTAGYGLGWVTGRVAGEKLVMHAGRVATQSSLALLNPKQDIGVAISLNVDNLDQYQYTNKYELGLNILKILAGENPEEIYRVSDDPTQNDYQLVREREAYTGTYLSANGATKLEIYKTDNGLKADQETRTGTISYQLDFASPSGVYFRNFAETVEANFQLTTEGEVTGLSGGFGDLNKEAEEQYKDYKEIELESGLKSIVPAEFKLVKTDADYNLVAGNSQLVIKTGLVKDKSYEQFLEQIEADREILLAGEEMIETIAAKRYREKSFIIEEAGERKQLLVGYTEWGGRYFAATLVCPYGRGTEAARDVLVPLFLKLELN